MMNDAPENFEALRKLLALKRHEQPPPGYFEQMPRSVLARLHEPPAPATDSLWQRWFAGLGLKPAVAYSFLTAVSAAIVLGISYSFRMENEPALVVRPDESWRLSASIPEFPAGLRPAGLALPAGDLSSSNWVFNGEDSLFERPRLRVQPASFSLDR